MTQVTGRASQRVLSTSERLVCILLAVLLLVVVGLAGWLNPDARGFGTHQQLGLPECLFRRVFGIGCPQCGMTTSLSHLVRGQLVAAMQANPMGIVLAAVAAVMFVLLLSSLVSGRLAVGLETRWLARIGGCYVLLCILLWATRIPF